MMSAFETGRAALVTLPRICRGGGRGASARATNAVARTDANAIVRRRRMLPFLSAGRVYGCDDGEVKHGTVTCWIGAKLPGQDEVAGLPGRLWHPCPSASSHAMHTKQVRLCTLVDRRAHQD